MLLVVLAGAEFIDATAFGASKPHGILKQNLNALRLAGSLRARDDAEDVSRLWDIERVQHSYCAVVADVDDGDIFGSEVCFSLPETSKPTTNCGDGAETTYGNNLKHGLVEARIGLLMELKQGAVELFAEGESRRGRVCEVVSGLGTVRSPV
jgi:hypothetical protein